MANVETISVRLKKLEDIEKKITTAMQNAGSTLQELAKDKPVDKQLERYTTTYMQTLDEVETEMATQISYLSQVATTQQHEGSCYAARKRAQLLDDTFTHVSKQLDEMISSCEKNQIKNEPMGAT